MVMMLNVLIFSIRISAKLIILCKKSALFSAILQHTFSALFPCFFKAEGGMIAGVQRGGEITDQCKKSVVKFHLATN
jgi:hypothetical protein